MVYRPVIVRSRGVVTSQGHFSYKYSEKRVTNNGVSIDQSLQPEQQHNPRIVGGKKQDNNCLG